MSLYWHESMWINVSQMLLCVDILVVIWKLCCVFLALTLTTTLESMKKEFSKSIGPHAVYFYTPAQRSCWGVYWFHSLRRSVRLSIRPSRIPCPLWSTYSFGCIHFISIHLIKQLQKVCCMQSFLRNSKIWIFVALTLSCFDLGSD